MAKAEVEDIRVSSLGFKPQRPEIWTGGRLMGEREQMLAEIGTLGQLISKTPEENVIDRASLEARKSKVEEELREHRPNRSPAVMAKRTASYGEGLDYFPTPPHATHALMMFIESEFQEVWDMRCLEPAGGGGHMVNVLKEYFDEVVACDVEDYRARIRGLRLSLAAEGRRGQGSSLDHHQSAIQTGRAVRPESPVGGTPRRRDAVSPVLSRIERRYNRLFKPFPPSNILVFSERVHMIHGRLPTPEDGGSATAFGWFIWYSPPDPSNYAGRPKPIISWIPPGRGKT